MQRASFQIATYIPQLARSDPNSWAMSICTVDGQRRSWGASKIPFCLQSVSKPFTYAIVLDELGAEQVFQVSDLLSLVLGEASQFNQ